MSNTNRRKKTILFLAANPEFSCQLRLDKEVKAIEEGLKRAEKRAGFKLEKRSAVTPKDMQRAILDLNPQIIHFSGHGVGKGGLELEDEQGQVKRVSAEALGRLFELFKEQIECVVLNACYSEVQAQAIVKYIPHVIGMKQAVSDQAAIAFAMGFYDALGAGKDFEFAYRSGCTSISMAGINEELTPIIKRQGDLDSPQIKKSGLSKISSPSITNSSDILENPEGSVSLDSPLYIERPPIELNCYEAILKTGALIRIKAPRQMGKTSLIQRILNHARQKQHQTAYLNFQEFDLDSLNSLDPFLKGFCANVANALEVDDQLTDRWQGSLGSKTNCSNYFQRYLLKTISQPLTLGLDEVDQVFQHLEIAQEFFGMLRTWHEKGKNEPSWQKLRLVIAHSKEVYIPLNINQSPFNVGLPIELPEFTVEQVTDLVKRQGLNWSNAEIETLMEMVDGHPYLVRKALYEMARNYLTLEEFIKISPTEQGLYSDHLRRLLFNLNQNNGELATAMKKVVASDNPVRLESTLGFKLRSMGLVKFRGNDVIPLCNLYRLYFSDRLEV
ncbi:AAA-like domain-containing protein [Planktothrix mougeotii]|uniref:AAA-like domain-containing protein n=1 Tax=Planktothrix mougeotii LEGE 06226 TaxID=1828728 RepID=A0ABR9UFC9_9CYAN|nr:AAA-like domain-containing protein [Planktothrix mougeotii]MBE9145170.1 AAA-like domain-containing protein [Planktothrix mougeotii LEGE 06226]